MDREERKNGTKTDQTTGGEFVIVIGRQYGSGGRSIGKQLADDLGVPYYDKSLLQEAAERMGMSLKLFEKRDERRPSILRSMLNFTYGSNGASYDSANISSENLYRAQSDVIREIARRGSCVIVGRTADYVLRDHPGLISIFLHAPLPHRAANVAKREETSDYEEAAEIAQRHDKNRESYYNYYTNRNWGDADNYHLSIDTSRVHYEAIAAMLRAIIEKR